MKEPGLVGFVRFHLNRSWLVGRRDCGDRGGHAFNGGVACGIGVNVLVLLYRPVLHRHCARANAPGQFDQKPHAGALRRVGESIYAAASSAQLSEATEWCSVSCAWYHRLLVKHTGQYVKRDEDVKTKEALESLRNVLDRYLFRCILAPSRALQQASWAHVEQGL
jgi:hypothetical protein